MNEQEHQQDVLEKKYTQYLKIILGRAQDVLHFNPTDFLDNNEKNEFERIEFKLGYTDVNPDEE